MVNEKYYNDIKDLPKQFARGLDLARNIKLEGNFDKVVICGMGGSSFYTALLNDILSMDGSIDIKIDAVKGYDLPLNAKKSTLFLMSSYSGNTEETISCLEEAQKKGFQYIAITSGGHLETIAKGYGAPILKIPGGIQPRLSTGYFIAGCLQILANCQIIPDMKDLVLDAAGTINGSLLEQQAQDLAKALMGNVPIIYSTDNISSIAYISKIKFNENSKTQSFWNYFPELNHNEMVGFTNMIMKPFFIIFRSQYTNPRNYKRMEVFQQILIKENKNIFILDLKGRNIFEEIMMAYYFVDHVTYYLAESYGIDPEPVDMVEQFKAALT